MIEYRNLKEKDKIISFFEEGFFDKGLNFAKKIMYSDTSTKIDDFLLKSKRWSNHEDLKLKFDILSVLINSNDQILIKKEEELFTLLLIKNIDKEERLKKFVNYLINNIQYLEKFQEQIYFIINNKNFGFNEKCFNLFVDELKEKDKNIKIVKYIPLLIKNNILTNKNIFYLFLKNEEILLNEEIINSIINNGVSDVYNITESVIYNLKNNNVSIIKILSNKMINYCSSTQFKDFDDEFFKYFIKEDNIKYFQWFNKIANRNKDTIKKDKEIQIKLFNYLYENSEVFKINNYYDFFNKFFLINHIKEKSKEEKINISFINTIINTSPHDLFLEVFSIYLDRKFEKYTLENLKDENDFNNFKKIIILLSENNQYQISNNNKIKIFELYICFLVNKYLTVEDDKFLIRKSDKKIEEVLKEEFEVIKNFSLDLINNKKVKNNVVINRNYFITNKNGKQFKAENYTEIKLKEKFNKKNFYENILIGHYMQEHAMLKLLNTFTQIDDKCNLLDFIKNTDSKSLDVIKKLFDYSLNQEKLIQTGGTIDQDIYGDIIESGMVLEFKKDVNEFSTEIEKSLISAINMHHIFFHNIYEICMKYVEEIKQIKENYEKMRKILNILVCCFNSLTQEWKDLYYNNYNKDSEINIKKILEENRHYIISYDNKKYVALNYFEYYLSSYKPKLNEYDDVLSFSFEIENKINKINFFKYLEQIILLGFIQDYNENTVISTVSPNGSGALTKLIDIFGNNEYVDSSEGIQQNGQIKVQGVEQKQKVYGQSIS